MSQNLLINYMEGVPVKISEKYKPPPIISLPLNIQRLKNDESNWCQVQYEFNLEQSVLSKIEQWKAVREMEKESRCERIRKHEQERVREVEENQKQLLTAVSYPSAEELSSDEEASFSPMANTTGYNQNEIKSLNLPQFSPSQQRFDTILMPTVVPESYKSKINSSKSNNFNKINYSDFENDTSSPFDNIELKTINDLDILAQVLNVTQIHSKNNDPSVKDDSNENVKKSSQSAIESIESVEESFINGNRTPESVNSYPNSFLQNKNTFYYNNVPFQNTSNSEGITKSDFCYYNDLPNNHLCNGYMYNNFGTNFENNHADLQDFHRPILNQMNYGNHSNLDVYNYTDSTVSESIQNKSKSVPDILKELNDEVNNSEIRRSRISDKQIETVRDKNNCALTKSQPEQIPDAFLQLSPSLQKLVKNISLMGFPLERVSKVAEKLGNDDKKIFEHLIPLSELVDLGFEETKISEALLRFNNNKEKALDFLIS